MNGDSLTHEQRRIVEDNMNLAYSVAHKYKKRTCAGIDFADICQVALFGLCNAVKRFDPDRGFALSTYAFPFIHGTIKRYLREHSSSWYVPRDYPMPESIPLDRQISNDDASSFQEYLAIESDFSGVNVDFSRLTHEEQKLISMRAKGLSQREIAKELELSQAQVSRNLRSTRRKLEDA